MFRNVVIFAVAVMLAGCASHHQHRPNIQAPQAPQAPKAQPQKHLTGKQAALNAWKAFNSGTVTTHTPSLADYTP